MIHAPIKYGGEFHDNDAILNAKFSIIKVGRVTTNVCFENKIKTNNKRCIL